MKNWNREGYTVVEKFAGQFEVALDSGEVVGTIVVGGADERAQIVADLDAGHDVDGWEDGAGGVICIR